MIVAALVLLASIEPRLAAGQSAVVSGTVLVDGSNRPLQNAEIQLVDLKLTARSDSAGNFSFRALPAGAHAITVRMPGYEQFSADFKLRATDRFDAEYLMVPIATKLKPVDVKAAANKPFATRLADFDERRAHGLGHYMTADVFEKEQGRPLSSFIKQYIPGLNLVQVGLQRWVGSARQACPKAMQASCGQPELQTPTMVKIPSGCYARVIVNGVPVFNGDIKHEIMFDIDKLVSSEIIGIEYYTTATAPAQYGGTTAGTCGTLMIWTKA